MSNQKQLFSQFSCKLGRVTNVKQEVIVTYFYEKKKRLANRYLKFDKVKTYKPNDYAKLAEKQIRQEVKNGFLEKYSDEYFLDEKRKPRMYASFVIIGAIACVTFASLFTYKALENTGLSAHIIDAPSGITLEGDPVVIGQKYEGKITVDTSKTDGKVLSDTVIVKSGDTTLVASTQYTFTLNDDNTIGNLIVFAEYVTGSITIEVTLITPEPPDPRRSKELTFTCEENGSDLVLLYYNMHAPRDIDVSYKIDSGTWIDLQVEQIGEDTYTIAEDLNVGQKVSVRGNNNYWSYISDGVLDVMLFSGSGKFSVANNIMSLLDSNNFATLRTIPKEACFMCLFSNGLTGSDIITDASQMVLPATTLKARCYASMFDMNSNPSSKLEKAPEILPAMTLEEGCYESMFNGCTGLITSPKLPATTLVNSCYHSMFNGCSSLNISENSGDYPFFTCPNITGLTQPVDSMFTGTKGFTNDPIPDNTYYYN